MTAADPREERPLYAVLHENDIGRGPEWGVASSVHVDRDRAENALGIREVPDGGE